MDSTLIHTPASTVLSVGSDTTNDSLYGRTLSQYNSTAFVVWYCILIVGCCLGPSLFILIQYCRIWNRRRLERGLEIDLDNMDAERQRDEVDRAISRVEANVHLFSQNESRRRRRAFQRSLREQTVILSLQHFQPIDDNETKTWDATAGNETDSTQLSDSSGKMTSSQLTQGCSICLGRYRPGDVVTASSNEACQHLFHLDCVVSWLSTRSAPLCPVCRQVFCREQQTLDLSLGSHSSSLTSSSDAFFVETDDTAPPAVATESVERE